MKSTKTKPNKKTAYVRAFNTKKIIIWIPPSLDVSDIDNKLSLLISNIKAVPINTTLYQNSFRIFYEKEISKYDTKIRNATFCTDAQTSGVSKGYLINTADDPNTATILSVDMAELDDKDNITININNVFALLSFHISHKKLAVRIDTLCGNQVLPSLGEGSRLLKMLEVASHTVGINKIALDPLPNAIPFYLLNNYRFLEKGDSAVTNSSDYTPDTSNSSDSFYVSGPMIQMQKNLAARKRWNMLKASTRLIGQFLNSKKNTELRNLQQTHKIRHDEELQKTRENLIIYRDHIRVPKEGKPINPPGSSFMTPSTFKPKTKNETPKTHIKPGNTFRLHNMIKEIKRNEKLTRKAQKAQAGAEAGTGADAEADAEADADTEDKGNAKGNRKTKRRQYRK